MFSHVTPCGKIVYLKGFYHAIILFRRAYIVCQSRVDLWQINPIKSSPSNDSTKIYQIDLIQALCMLYKLRYVSNVCFARYRVILQGPQISKDLLSSYEQYQEGDILFYPGIWISVLPSTKSLGLWYSNGLKVCLYKNCYESLSRFTISFSFQPSLETWNSIV